MTATCPIDAQAPSKPEHRFDWNAAIVESVGRPIKADSSWLVIVDSDSLPDDLMEKLFRESRAVIVKMGLGFGGGNFYAESTDNGISIERGSLLTG